MTKEEISKKLQDLRIANGYTQKQLADTLGMKNYSTISSWEIGKSEPSLSTFAKLCSIYGISDIEEVFPGLTSKKDAKKTPTVEDTAEAIMTILSAKLGRTPTPKEMRLLNSIVDGITQYLDGDNE